LKRIVSIKNDIIDERERHSYLKNKYTKIAPISQDKKVP